MPVNPAKAELRAQLLARRQKISPEQAQKFAVYLEKKGVELAEALRPNAISAYFALPGEAPTQLLLNALFAKGFVTVLPVTGKRGEPLIFRTCSPEVPLIPGKMGIFEPGPDAAEVSPELLFVPLAGFDRQGQRIGYGAGFYDLTLARLRARQKITAIGIAYACQEIEKVPAEAHDEKLDFVLTEAELIQIQPG